MSIKRLHTFTVKLNREVEDISTSTQDGKEITVKSKVVKEVPITFAIKEPNRRERQDLSLFYGISYNEALEKKLMPKVLLVQKVLRNGDSDSPLSLDEDKNLAKMYEQINSYRDEFIRLDVDNITEEQKKRKEEVLSNFIILQKKIVDIQTAYQSLFSHTAEAYAQNKMATWAVLNLSYKVNDKGEEEPYFAGKTFEDKENTMFDLEEKRDELYFKAIEKLSTYCGLYIIQKLVTPEQFKEFDEQMEKEAKLSEQARLTEEAKKAEIKDEVQEEPQNVV